MNTCSYILYVKEKTCWTCVMWKERGTIFLKVPLQFKGFYVNTCNGN